MRDEDDRDAELALELDDEVEDARLNCDIKRRCRLVANQEVGITRQGNGDDHALAHSAGELVGIALKSSLRLRNADQLEKLDAPGVKVRPREVSVLSDALCQLTLNRHSRIKRGEGVLENHGDVIALKPDHFLVREGHEIDGVLGAIAPHVGELGRTRLHDLVARANAHDLLRRHRLT